MALRDRFSKIAAYFSSDDLADGVDEVTEDSYLEAPAMPEKEEKVKEEATQKEPDGPRYERPTAPTSRPQHDRVREVEDVTPNRPQVEQAQRPSVPLPERPTAPTSRPQPRESQRPVAPVSREVGQTKISLKHPLRYEDATTIADIFLEGQCVLVDFEYMQEAQARRCIDFLTGACRVVNGHFQRIGATIYLLTPSGVIVDIEDVRPQTKGQEVSYDYDIKRR